MSATIYIVKTERVAQLAIMPRPRGSYWLEDDLASVAQQGFDVVVSLLEDAESEYLELSGEAEACRQIGLDYVNIPIPDRGTPAQTKEILAAITSLADLCESGKSVVIHCRMAYGRAPMIATAILISHGESVENAVAAVAAARGCQVPETRDQLAWLQDYSVLRARSQL
jgi:protein-tyrosine phosphatase